MNEVFEQVAMIGFVVSGWVWVVIAAILAAAWPSTVTTVFFVAMFVLSVVLSAITLHGMPGDDQRP